jgi:hypothetical protein
MQILDSILVVYPKAKDCMWGHIGSPVYSVETQMEDDRVTVTRIKRCGHCDMPIGTEDE